MRLIDAEHLTNDIALYMAENAYLNDTQLDLLKKVAQWIIDTPTIDPESLRAQGEWVGEADGYADGELVYDVWYCSECNYCIDDGTDDPDLLSNYCPNCGAKMKGGTDER